MMQIAKNAAVVCLLAFLAVPLRAEPAKVAGVWNLSVELEVGTGHPVVTLSQDGEKISGKYEGRYGTAPVEGTVKDQAIEFIVTMSSDGNPAKGVFKGTVNGDSMSGTFEFDEIGGGKWSGVRAAAK
jgi:hypothetical protein